MMPIKLSENFELNAVDYANEGNSDIGIRGSGKTHTATAIAEGLMDNNIPIVVFDPSGVWHNLRYGANGKPGYPVVVAGGAGGDLVLDDNNATDILQAAMQENISIVFDLTEVESKAKEIRIVADCVDYLMQHNKSYKTLRHVFIEEAAEYCPQKLNPGLFTVFSKIERMARIGRNNGLGFTLINQRSQEIAKSIFELCDRVFVHRQTGNNSLACIDTWLKYKGIEDKNDIIKSLPRLNPGECWIIDLEGEHQVKVLPKKTFHPDPKKGVVLAPAGSSADISGFIEKMKAAMPEKIHVEIAGRNHGKTKQAIDEMTVKIDALLCENAELKAKYEHLIRENNLLKQQYARATERLRKIMIIAATDMDETSEFTAEDADKIRERMKSRPVSGNLMYKEIMERKADNEESIIEKEYKTTTETSKLTQQMNAELTRIPHSKTTRSSSNPVIGGSALRILKTVALFYPMSVSRTRIGLITSLSTTSGSFGTYIATLKREELITVSNNQFSITDKGLQVVKLRTTGELETLPTGEALVDMWYKIVGGSAARILRYVADIYPAAESKENIGRALNLSHTSGSFGTYISTLKRNQLIKVSGGYVSLSDELYN